MRDFKSERQNERRDLTIWASVRLIDTQFKVANVDRIRYLARGWNIEEAQAPVYRWGNCAWRRRILRVNDVSGALPALGQRGGR